MINQLNLDLINDLSLKIINNPHLMVKNSMLDFIIPLINCNLSQVAGSKS